MKNFPYFVWICLAISGASCHSNLQSDHSDMLIENNPFLQPSPLQYQAPQFDKIVDTDFEPAFEFGLKQQLQEVDAIANLPDAPTFENTVVALETSGRVLNRAQMVFYNLTSANTNPTLQALEARYAPVFAAHHDQIYLNDKLYNRIKIVYDHRVQEGLRDEDLRLLEYYKENFEINGAGLPDEKKQQLRVINQELATQETQFSSKLLAARKNGALLIENIEDLSGLTTEEVETARSDAKEAGEEGKYLLKLVNTTQQPFLATLINRDTREKLFNASVTRAEKDNADDTRQTLESIAKLRLQKAKLLARENFAAWKLQDQMAKTPERALNLLKQLAGPSVTRAKEEAKEIQHLIDQQNGGFTLEPWDWSFYAEQIRKAKYALDESQLKPYFEVRNVLEKGVFYAAEKLFGITFKVREDLPVYHPDVVAYEVFDEDGRSLAIYYLDFYARDNKSGGAWMNNMVNQSHYLKQKPVIVNVFNFQKPTEGNPSLITYDDVTTMFHEFGHSIHGIFADQKWESLSGTNTPRDFVEFPSQVNEQWALDPAVLKNYAIHYKTGETIPEILVEKLKTSKTFNQGYAMTEIVSAATLDMAWHTVANEEEFLATDLFEKKALGRYQLQLKVVPPRYHSSYFLHIWSNGYSAGYYAYLWSEMLDYSAYQWFEEHGGMTRENGDRFRKYILSVGNSVDLNEAFRNFTGSDPDIEPLLVGKGLK